MDKQSWIILTIMLALILACMIMQILDNQIYYKFGQFKIEKKALNQLTETQNPAKLCNIKTGACIILERIK